MTAVPEPIPDPPAGPDPDLPGYLPTDFDWGLTGLATAMAMVRSQLEFSWFELRSRLARLTDDEFSWEPASGALAVRRRGQTRTPRAVGAGEWVTEWPRGGDDPGPRTIGWLVIHLTDTFFERWEWTFGDQRRRAGELEHYGDRRNAVAELTRWVQAWVDGVAGLDEDQVFAVGLSQAGEIDRQAPFGHLVLHLNRELIHHGSEIMVLQDLFAAQHRSPFLDRGAGAADVAIEDSGAAAAGHRHLGR